MSEPPLARQLPRFDTPPPPPPPPPETFEDERSMGLATEFVFSGQQRQELRNSLRSAHSAVQEMPSTAQQLNSIGGDVRPNEFGDTNFQDNHTESSEQRFALTTFILMSLIGLGILVILVLLMYQVILG